MAVFSAGGMVTAVMLALHGNIADAAGLVSATTLLLVAAVMAAAGSHGPAPPAQNDAKYRHSGHRSAPALPWGRR